MRQNILFKTSQTAYRVPLSDKVNFPKSVDSFGKDDSLFLFTHATDIVKNPLKESHSKAHQKPLRALGYSASMKHDLFEVAKSPFCVIRLN